MVRERPRDAGSDRCRINEGTLTASLPAYPGQSRPDWFDHSLDAPRKRPCIKAHFAGWPEAWWIRDSQWDWHNARENLDQDIYALRDLSAKGFQASLIVEVGGFIGIVAGLMRRLWPAAELIGWEPNQEAHQLYSLNAPDARLIPLACSKAQ